MSQTAEKKYSVYDRAARFVDDVIEKCSCDKGFAAHLRRADNPATEYQSWEILAYYGVDIEKEYQRLPFASIGAAIARAKVSKNGKVKLGKALARCYEDGSESSPARARIRRLLACEELSEVCRVLRSVLSLVNSKTDQPLDYITLLRQLLRFNWDRKRVQVQWAQEFYSRGVAGEGT